MLSNIKILFFVCQAKSALLNWVLMSRRKIPLLLLIVGVALIFIAILWFAYSQQFGSAAITVESIPEANVYVNDEMVGRTPYTGEFKAGDVVVKLIPLAFDSPRIPYEVNVKLTSGVNTIVKRTLGETELDSSGEIVSFEKTNENKSAVAVVTKPDNSQVTLEGKPSEHSPVRFSDIEPGTYSLKVTANGYQERTLSINTEKGYTLTAIVDLAKLPEQVQGEQNPLETEVQKEQQKTIVIEDTPVGFLRVRADASAESEEVDQVEPGEEFALLETSEDGEWYKIEPGWISSEYAEVKEPIEQEER